MAMNAAIKIYLSGNNISKGCGIKEAEKSADTHRRASNSLWFPNGACFEEFRRARQITVKKKFRARAQNVTATG